MTNYTKPEDLGLIWASTGISSKPSDFKWVGGWTQEKPPFEQMNYIHKKHDSWSAYANQKGIPEWDSSTIYYTSSIVQVGGAVYRSKTNSNTNNNPSSDITEVNWRLLFTGNSRLVPESDFTSFGKALISRENSTEVFSILGFTTLGIDLVKSVNGASARNVLGFTSTGNNLATAVSISSAQTSLGFSEYAKGLITPTASGNVLQYLSLTNEAIVFVRKETKDEMITHLGITGVGRDLIKQTTTNGMRSYLGVVGASESTAGLVEEATQAEVNTGNGNYYVTPPKMRFGLTLSLGTNGGIALPSWLGNITFNWGSVTINNDSNVFVSWAVPYGPAGQVYQFFGNFGSSGNNQNSGLFFETTSSLNGRIYHNGSNSPRIVRWWSVGRRVVQ